MQTITPEIIRDKARMQNPWLGLRFPWDLVDRADRVEVESSTITDPTKWGQFRLMRGNQCLASRRIVVG